MRILILDDMQARHHAFMVKLASMDEEIVSVYSAEEAEKYFTEWNFEFAFLDHDLGLGKKDGRRFVRDLINSDADISKTTFIVHSSNTYGGNEMVAMLKDVGAEAVYRPFIHGVI